VFIEDDKFAFWGGEVALIVAAMGLSTNLITQDLFATVIVVVIVTTVVTPPMMKWFFQSKKQTKSVLNY
jgi:Kef-type K+ transport system membrane component KefB